MSKGNPRKAMAALLPLPIKVGRADERAEQSEGSESASTLYVRPMTLGMWAALERIGSPLVTGAEPKDALELIPSLYLLTHDPREVFQGNILDLAMNWADTVPVGIMDEIKRACDRQMGAAFDVIPEIDPKKGTGAAMTAGLPRSSTARPQPTDGATPKSCGKSRCRRSSSSKGAKRSTTRAK